MNTTQISSTGSTQKAVLAAPPHPNSPSLARVCKAAAFSTTENPRPNPMPSMAVSLKVDWPISFSSDPPGRWLRVM